jgi:hypothetical protein
MSQKIILFITTTVRTSNPTRNVQAYRMGERDILESSRVEDREGSWRKLHNEELHNLYSSPNVIRMMKSRRMRWAGNERHVVEKRTAYRILV